jgi:pyruvate dehydrogenase E2 component (dihydrolipoamide acetyltransferase)
MATDVIMPQMGESIAEGTIVKWLKKVGDEVKRDEPLFEISTDKVDAEIPSPTAGTLVEILVKEGQTVPINTVVARIDVAGSRPAAAPAEQKAEEKPAEAKAAAASTQSATEQQKNVVEKQEAETAKPAQAQAAQASAPASTTTSQTTAVASAAPAKAPSIDELRKQRSSPLVRKIARENEINIGEVEGTGLSGRVTKNDILSYIESKPAASAAQAPQAQAPQAQASAPAPAAYVPQPAPVQQAPAPAPTPQAPTYQPGDRVEIVPMTPMRKKIAEHMVASKRTSAHVASVFEIDMTRIAKMRDAHKERFFERNGVKLTFTPFIVKATVDALKVWPILNASIEGDNVVYKKDINIGVAVALDWGLIVPVIKNADEKNLLGITRSLTDLANRARNKQLKPEEVQGGTFTITNPGVYGSLFGTPIISQPQVAIMGVGTIEKRLTVTEDDAIGIRTKAYFSISFDHRLIDGAVADQFMAQVKKNLENFNTTEL